MIKYQYYRVYSGKLNDQPITLVITDGKVFPNFDPNSVGHPAENLHWAMFHTKNIHHRFSKQGNFEGLEAWPIDYFHETKDYHVLSVSLPYEVENVEEETST